VRFLLLTLIALSILVSCGSPIEDGYCNKTSFFVGERVSVYVNAKKNIKGGEISISDINGRKQLSFEVDLSSQVIKNRKPYENGFGYDTTFSFVIPDIKSGVYLVEDKIPFLVKSSEPTDITIVYPSNTENAYSSSGGKSTYGYNSSDKTPATVVSFERPIGLPFYSADFFKWIANNKDYSIGYICDKDLDDYNTFKNSKLLIVPGHSEYWSRNGRLNFDQYISEGRNALILSGNSMWWQVRYNDSNNQMICYKNLDKDPIHDPELKTINWTKPSLNLPVIKSIGLDFNFGGYGKKEDNGWDGYKIVNSSFPLFNGTGLNTGDIISLPTVEYDGANLVFDDSSDSVFLNNTEGFYKYNLIGYDLASRKKHSNGAWVIMQRDSLSGIVVNTGSTNWCSSEGINGKNSKEIKQITLNAIDLLLQAVNE